jgi:hypothetical protein
MRVAIACLSLLAGVLALASPANALTTTYIYWGSNWCDFDDPAPELCINGEPTVLTVTFRHDEPIWDNDASGCHPRFPDSRCRVSYFTELVDISFSPTVDLDPDEVLGFDHADFLGSCPSTDCGGPGPPYITLVARDVETGLRIFVGANDPFFEMAVAFPDGRIEENCCDWIRLPTVAEPETGALLGTGLFVLIVMRRTRDRGVTPRLERARTCGSGWRAHRPASSHHRPDFRKIRWSVHFAPGAHR